MRVIVLNCGLMIYFGARKGFSLGELLCPGKRCSSLSSFSNETIIGNHGS